jgi:hypothetical protein
MKKLYLIVALLIIFSAIVYSTLNKPQTKLCNYNSDCDAGLYADCGGELCIPQWKVFCDDYCRTPRNYTEWVSACNSNFYMEDCYQQAAYTLLRKTNEENYTIIWTSAFRMCEEYPENVKQCKIQVCENLAAGDGNLKYNYPESKLCLNESES